MLNRKNKRFTIPIIVAVIGLILVLGCEASSEQARQSQQNGANKQFMGEVSFPGRRKPNPEKCPDGIWDEAEQKDPSLCPQDKPNRIELAPQQNQIALDKAIEWPYDVPYNILVTHILSNNLSGEDKAVLQSSLEDMKSGENRCPYWDEVRVAISKDGFHFEDSRRTVVTHASVPAAVVDNQGCVWLFYVDFSPEPIERLIKGEKVEFKSGFQGLAAAVSDDGFTFRKVDLEIQNVVQGVTVDPHIVVTADGTFQLYYLGVPALELSANSGDPAKSSGAHSIYLATAKSDLSKWQQQGVAWADPQGGADPVVWQINEKIYYIASGGTGKSTDGGYSFLPTTETELPRVNDNGGPPGTPDILKVEGGYRLFHTTKEGIKSLFSKDGIGWQEESGIRGLGADPTVVKLKDGTYLMYYKARTLAANFKSAQQKQGYFPQSSLLLGISLETTGAKYKTVSTKPANGWFRSGQDADIMLSGIDFNNTGGPLLFNHPGEVASDGVHLLLADRNNNRVLIWNTLPASNTPPDLVLGQKNFITNEPGKQNDQMNWPVGVCAQKGKVAVADTYNDRVLIWNSFPTKNGQPADLIIENRVRWPWDVWTNGNKFAISNTGGSNVFLWDSFPLTSQQVPDVILTAQGKMGTPRGITSDGRYFIVADHNNRASSGSATFVWKNWPALDATHDFLLDGWRTGTFLPDNSLILLSTTHFPPSIWKRPPADAKDLPALQLAQVQGAVSHNLQTGDGSDIACAGNRLYLSLSNGNKILVYNSIPQNSTQNADFAIGASDIQTNTLETNFFLTNPIVATDGRSLFASSDFDKQLYVWKSLPDQSNAHPDFVYRFKEAGAWDNVLWKNTLALAGGKTVYLWKNLPLNGELPDVVLTDRIGSVQLQELRGIAADNKYFYLADFSANKVYIFEGIPDINSEPKFTLAVYGPGRLSSDGKYLVVATTLDNQTGHIKIFAVADLSNDAKPKIIERDIAPTNLPQDALADKGSFFIANTAGNIVYAWRNIEDALAGKPYDTILGDSSTQDCKPEIGKNKVFWPGSLAFDGSFLWVGEFKFSGRILRFSVGQ